MIHILRNISAKILVSSLILLVAFMEVSQAKRDRLPGLSFPTGRDPKIRRGGCAAFGHSCFGGHGKRAAVNFGDEEEVPVVASRSEAVGPISGGNEPRARRMPHSAEQPEMSALNLFFSQEYRKPEIYERMSPFLRKWLENLYQRRMVGDKK